MIRGRARVTLRKEDGLPVNPDIPSRASYPCAMLGGCLPSYTLTIVCGLHRQSVT